MSIPNGLNVVADLAAQFPAEWRAAHTGGPDTEAFIRRVAWVLHSTVDARFGLTGKRGAPNDISDDAICYDGESVLGDVDPTRGNAPVTVFDVIGGAGGPNPTPTWNAVGPATPRPHAAWVKPEPVGSGSAGGGSSSTPPPPTGPDLTPILNAIAALSAKVDGVRMIADAAHSEASAAHYEALNAASRASEIKTQIANLPAPGTPAAFPPYEGRVFGTKVRLEPK